MSSLALYVLVFLATPVACTLCTTENIELVARIVFGEARGRNDQCQLAVAFTVVNRVNTPGFPKTVPEVLNQTYNNGQNHQFVTLDRATDDAQWVEAKAYNTLQYRRSRDAAWYAVCGTKSDPTFGATFFCTNPSCGTDYETPDIKVVSVKHFGNHYFFVMGPR